MDRGAWWAAVHRATQSQTQLKQLSMHAWIGEGNGNPLQYSCLENPRERGAWWAAVYGVAQSWTWLKWLSSSSSELISRLPSLIWVSCIQSAEGLNLTESSPPSKGEFLLLDCFWIGTPVFPACRLELKHWLFLCLEPASLWTGTPTLARWFSGLGTQNEIKTSALLGLQLDDSPSRSWDLPASRITWVNFTCM